MTGGCFVRPPFPPVKGKYSLCVPDDLTLVVDTDRRWYVGNTIVWRGHSGYNRTQAAVLSSAAGPPSGAAGKLNAPRAQGVVPMGRTLAMHRGYAVR
jgi:hypothetical protein